MNFAVSFVTHRDQVDYFLVGVESKKQLMDILNMESDFSEDLTFLKPLLFNLSEKSLDPRKWS